MDFSKRFSYWLAGVVTLATAVFCLVAYVFGQDVVDTLKLAAHLFAVAAGLVFALGIIGLLLLQLVGLHDDLLPGRVRVVIVFAALTAAAFLTLSPGDFMFERFMMTMVIMIGVSAGAAMLVPKRFAPDSKTLGLFLASFAPIFGLKLAWEFGYAMAGRDDNLKGFIVGTIILGASFLLIPRLAAQQHKGVEDVMA